jgi:hypothetical protein
VRPVYWLITWLLYRAFGVNPSPFHLLSMSIDLANAVLLAWLTQAILNACCELGVERKVPID